MKSFAELPFAVLALLSLFPSFIAAQAPSASTLYISETQTQFSLNIANDTNDTADVFFYFTSPAYSWVGVGFGEQMKDSLMFIFYPSKDGNNVTVSPRLASGHSEPSVTNDVKLEILPGTGVQDDMFIVEAVCHSCRVWPGGSLDIASTSYPMIYAFGPGNMLQSDSLSPPLRRHVRYGKFTMNMAAALGKGEVPAASNATSGVELDGGMTKDHDRANLAHAILGCLALFVLWPLNVIVAGFFKKIQLHIGLSVFILVFLIISFGLGISTSSEYNRSKSFKSPHQIFAFISILPILVLSILPARPIARLTPLIPRLHTPLTSVTLIFLILTGGLGLSLSSQTTSIIAAYTAISIGVFAFCLLLGTCIKRRGSAYSRAHRRQPADLDEDEQNLVLANYWANRKLEDESRSASQASLRPGTHERSASATSVNRNLYGGGTMPGPQYLLNMHPGVPVYPENKRWSSKYERWQGRGP